MSHVRKKLSVLKSTEDENDPSQLDLKLPATEVLVHGINAAKIFQNDDDESFLPVKKSPGAKKIKRAELPKDFLSTPSEVSSPKYSTSDLNLLKNQQHSLRSNVSSTDQLELNPLIPDSHSIHKAKQLREQRRLASTKPIPDTPPSPSATDFISLSKTTKIVDDEEESNSRLVTEDQIDDNDEEVFEDYKGSRIQFSVTDESGKKKVAKEFDELANGENLDEEIEDERWVLEQMEKAGVANYEDYKNLDDESVDKFQDQAPIISQIPTLPSIFSTLNQSLNIATQAFEVATDQLARMKLELNDSESKKQKLELDRHFSKNKFEFYQQWRGWSLDYADFLDEKFDDLTELENEAFELQELVARNQIIETARLQKDVISQFVEFQSTWSLLQETSPESVDILDEEYQFRVEQFNNQVVLLTLDVRLDFLSVEGIVNKFAEWQSENTLRTDFEDIFGEDSLVDVLEFTIRLELLTFDFSKNNQSIFESLQFFAQLQRSPFAISIIQKIIEKIFIPKFRSLLSFGLTMQLAEEKNNLNLGVLNWLNPQTIRFVEQILTECLDCWDLNARKELGWLTLLLDLVAQRLSLLGKQISEISGKIMGSKLKTPVDATQLKIKWNWCENQINIHYSAY
ncbi:hypothetical protein HK096_001280 [Nowakowskiella sp. JEL0078]|nr:hypothetical protein HK096_001280 [Nowakowskiella sp. JEL0078]